MYLCEMCTHTGAFFGYNITHSTLFDYEDDDLGHKSLAEMKQMVSLQLIVLHALHVCNYIRSYVYTYMLN